MVDQGFMPAPTVSTRRVKGDHAAIFEKPEVFADWAELIARQLIPPWRGIEIPAGSEGAFITLRNRIVTAQGKQASTCCANIHSATSTMVKKRGKQKRLLLTIT